VEVGEVATFQGLDERRAARITGVLWILTFVTSIPA
jgi:hypothetical protein